MLLLQMGVISPPTHRQTQSALAVIGMANKKSVKIGANLIRQFFMSSLIESWLFDLEFQKFSLKF